jgi:4-diphosphocytidyl-2-C-methyl-D-erythritol kinase
MKQIAYAKVNIFLKISGRRDNYHEIVSRFMIVKNLFDEIEFIEELSK